MGDTQNAWFIEKILLKWMIWRYPHFRKPPYGNILGFDPVTIGHIEAPTPPQKKWVQILTSLADIDFSVSVLVLVRSFILESQIC